MTRTAGIQAHCGKTSSSIYGTSLTLNAWLVGHQKWQAGMAAFCKPFTGAKVHHFHLHEMDVAHDWIWADLPVMAGQVKEQSYGAPIDRVQEASEESFPASDAPGY